MLRRGIFVLFAAFVAALATVPVARAQPAGVAVVDLDGKGFGHGVGLSQWGAMYMAQAGQSHDAILATFYPGTTLSTTSPADVRVAVYNAADRRATLSFPDGGQVRSSPSGAQAPGFPVDVAPGGSVVISFDGVTYRVSPVVTAQAATAPATWTAPTAEQEGGCIPLLGPCPPPTTGGGGGDPCGLVGCPTTTPPPTSAPPPTTAPPSGGEPPTTTTPATPRDTTPPPQDPGVTSGSPVWAAPASGGTVGVAERGRRYRGLVEATGSGGPLRLVNQLDVETYLKGMGEVPGAWPLEAVGAQAVVARTYVLRAMSASGEICDYDLCQVYLGADNESAGQSAAVDATAGQILTYAGGLATTVYSADAGGVSATTLEGFGTDSSRYPYLTTVRYDTPNPLPWHNQIALSDVASRFGYGGALESVSLGETGPSGRALTVVLRGSAGDAAVDGRLFAARLGLRSTLFTPKVGTADTAPAAPQEGAAVQVLPDDTAALQAATRTPPSASARASARSVAAPARSAVPKAVTDLAERPATWLALGALALVTALALSRYGIDAPALATPGGLRLPVPGWALWTWADVRRNAEGARERRGQRRLAKERAALAAVVIPPAPDDAAGMSDVAADIATPAALEAWSPLFPHPPRLHPLRAEGAAPAPPPPPAPAEPQARRPRLRARRRP